MYRHPSRREQHIEKIEAFLNDKSRTKMELQLYNREISPLENEFPEINITKGNPFKSNMALFTCTISKR